MEEISDKFRGSGKMKILSNVPDETRDEDYVEFCADLIVGRVGTFTYILKLIM